MITFREQFDKLVKAYMNDEVDPFHLCRCFVGNLLNGRMDWGYIRQRGKYLECESNPQWKKRIIEHVAEGCKCVEEESKGTYSAKEIEELENNFMGFFNWSHAYYRSLTDEKKESVLFEAFSDTLQMLKELHESKGEVVEDYVFNKREMVKTST